MDRTFCVLSPRARIASPKLLGLAPLDSCCYGASRQTFRLALQRSGPCDRLYSSVSLASAAVVVYNESTLGLARSTDVPPGPYGHFLTSFHIGRPDPVL